MKCSICDKEFPNVKEMMSHINSVHEISYENFRINCFYCQTNFSSYKSLRAHCFKVHEGKKIVKSFICGICNTTRFSLKLNLQAHITSHHYIIKVRHSNDERDNQSWQCNPCNVSFKSKKSFIHHLSNTDKNKKCYNCPMRIQKLVLNLKYIIG